MYIRKLNRDFIMIIYIITLQKEVFLLSLTFFRKNIMDKEKQITAGEKKEEECQN